ncbi:MAG: hypothetical protein WCJ94_00220 [bacterium]
MNTGVALLVWVAVLVDVNVITLVLVEDNVTVDITKGVALIVGVAVYVNTDVLTWVLVCVIVVFQITSVGMTLLLEQEETVAIINSTRNTARMNFFFKIYFKYSFLFCL